MHSTPGMHDDRAASCYQMARKIARGFGRSDLSWVGMRQVASPLIARELESMALRLDGLKAR
jgi:hypothetical protein